MSSGELERVEVMGRVGSGDLKMGDAAVMLKLSYRQVKRLWRRYRQMGRKGLQHGNAGRPSNRSKPAKFRRRVLSLIRKKYSGSEEERFGPTLAAEHLAEEDGMVLDHDTLRLWMLQEGLWSRQRKRKKHRQRRERRRHFGELVQLDGSFHDWLEGRGAGGCLMDMVDDVTSQTQARMGKEETIWAAVGVHGLSGFPCLRPRGGQAGAAYREAIWRDAQSCCVFELAKIVLYFAIDPTTCKLLFS